MILFLVYLFLILNSLLLMVSFELFEFLHLQHRTAKLRKDYVFLKSNFMSILSPAFRRWCHWSTPHNYQVVFGINFFVNFVDKLMRAVTSIKLSPSGRHGLIGYGVRNNGIVENHLHRYYLSQFSSFCSGKLLVKSLI